ncbi:MAG: hypothetical protein JWQ34_182 [Mucilaginibacter sp.]|uniref:glycosyltransferase n=1 Tax=Mucilaginibacter sp. TaxID=1882438 RepID=UPI0026359392|nr:glycosyltransferase [Mucilaginibacter sp.]MDB5001957.1 hypothetical protein [Mucilaginibacter sp.]
MKPVLVLTYWSFKDALVQTYTLPYVKIIAAVSKRKVYLVCLEQSQLKTSYQERIKTNADLQKDNMQVIFLEYNRFGIKQILMWSFYLTKLLYFVNKKGVEYIHTWGTPAGAIGYLLSILSGKPLILDSYEPHAETMIENGTWKLNSWAYKILFELEIRQSHRAKYYIAAASGMKDYAQKTYNLQIDNNCFFTKPACTDLEKFNFMYRDSQLINELDLDGKIICVYAGKFGGIYLDDEIFDFFKQCFKHWKGNFRILMLTNASIESISKQLQRVQIPNNVLIQKFVPHYDIPKYLAIADFALTPVKPIPTKRYCTPIKDGEYWATGLPVVITSNISDDSDIIEENNAGYVLKSLTDNEYNNAITKIDDLLKEDNGLLKKRIRALAYKYRNFDIVEKIYRQIYSVPDTVK